VIKCDLILYYISKKYYCVYDLSYIYTSITWNHTLCKKSLFGACIGIKYNINKYSGTLITRTYVSRIFDNSDFSISRNNFGL